MIRAALALGCVAMAIAAWMLRFDTDGVGVHTGFMLDRWTGSVYRVTPASVVRVREMPPAPVVREMSADEFLDKK